MTEHEFDKPTEPSSKKPDPSKRLFADRASLRWLGIGIEFVGVLGIFTYGGYQADKYLHTEPWLMIVGFGISFVGMFYLLIKESGALRK